MTKTSPVRAFCAAVIATVLATSSASASILVDQASPYGGYSIGANTDWAAFSASLGAQPGGYVVGSVGDSAAVASADAIIVVLRDNNFGTNKSLSSAEIANLTSFIASGRRVLLVGEGNFWDEWDNSILALASGGTATAGAVFSGNATPAGSNALTTGVSSALLQGAGTTTGGTALFGTNFATLWGTNQNVLTVLDANVFQQFPAPTFRDNVAAWLGASAPTAAVPEPQSWAMAILGLFTVGSLMRRRPAQAPAHA